MLNNKRWRLAVGLLAALVLGVLAMQFGGAPRPTAASATPG